MYALDTFVYRPRDVETHRSPHGIILCTGRNCLGCNPKSIYDETITFDQWKMNDLGQRELHSSESWLENVSTLKASREETAEASNEKMANSERLAGEICQNNDINEVKDDVYEESIDGGAQKQKMKRNEGLISRPEVLSYSISSRYCRSDCGVNTNEIVTSHSDDMKGKNDNVDVYSFKNCNNDNVFCLRFRRNFIADKILITDIGYALEDQFSTTERILSIAKQRKGWKIWVRGEWMKEQLTQNGLLLKNRLYHLEEVC